MLILPLFVSCFGLNSALVESRRAAAAAERRVAFVEAELERAAAEVLRLKLCVGEDMPEASAGDGASSGGM